MVGSEQGDEVVAGDDEVLGFAGSPQPTVPTPPACSVVRPPPAPRA